MKYVFALMGILLSASITFAQTESAVEDYKQQRESLVTLERFDFAHQKVQQSAEPEVINEAIQDLLKHSTIRDEYQSALTTIQGNIQKLDKNSLPYIEARLAEAKFLARLGQNEEAETIFQNAIQNEWQHAMWRYSENLIDAGKLDQAAIMEFKRVTDYEPYSFYRSESDDLSIFITLLRLMRNDTPTKSAITNVANHLDEFSQASNKIKAAKALCLAEDDRYDEALNLFSELENDPEVQTDENLWQNLPLYKASVLFEEGTRISEAKAELGKYLDQTDYKNLHQKVLRITRDLLINVEDIPKIHHATQFLLDGPIINDPEMKEQFSDPEIAEIYDMHHMGLAFDGRLDESAQIGKFVMDNYYPETLAGANCAMNWARYIGTQGQKDEAVEIFKDILKRAPFDDVVPWVKFSLAEYYHDTGNDTQALLLVSEILNLVKERDRGSITRCRDVALELQEKILKAKN